MLSRGDELIAALTGCASAAEADRRIAEVYRVLESLAVFRPHTEAALLDRMRQAAALGDVATEFAVMAWGHRRWPALRHAWLASHPTLGSALLELSELSDAIDPNVRPHP